MSICLNLSIWVKMPPRFGAPAPKCAKCEKPVYAAEQAIGPASKIYHKPCLACTVCGRRLDSSLLVDHEGEPMCHNCYKAHLGQGKGGFTKAVPLRPAIGGSAAPSSLAAIHPGAKSATFAGAAGSPVDPSISQSSQQRNPFSRSKTIGLSNGTPLCARCEMPVCEYSHTPVGSTHEACLTSIATHKTLPSKNRLRIGNGTEPACAVMAVQPPLNQESWRKGRPEWSGTKTYAATYGVELVMPK